MSPSTTIKSMAVFFGTGMTAICGLGVYTGAFDEKTNPTKSLDQMEREGHVVSDERQNFRLTHGKNFFGFGEPDIVVHLPDGRNVTVSVKSRNYDVIEDVRLASGTQTYRLQQEIVVRDRHRAYDVTLCQSGKDASTAHALDLAGAILKRESFMDAAHDLLAVQLPNGGSLDETHQQFQALLERLQNSQSPQESRPQPESNGACTALAALAR